MSLFFESYCSQIYEGLKKCTVIDGRKEALTVEDGLKRWVRQAKKVRDESRGLLFFCGNGASATMAEHMSHDWFQNAMVNTATCAETAHITAIANDLSYEEIFSYRIGRILSEKDMLITISSSGNSDNIIRAQEAGRKKGAFLVTLSGMRPDNKSLNNGDINFYVPLETYGTVECAHSLLLHGALDLFLSEYMGGLH